MACRDISKAKQAINDMNLETDSKKLLIPVKLDLASQVSVRECATKLHEDYPEGINILVNNAGVYAIGNPTRMETDDGHELHLGTNHLGHFSLTLMLLDSLRKGAMYSNSDSKIINVSSALYKNGNINFNDIHMKQGYDAEKAYANSKLANLLFTKQLYEKLKRDRTGQPGAGRIKVYASHPGIAATDLSRYFSTNIFKKFMVWLATKLILRTPEQGNASTIELVRQKASTLTDGGFYGNGLIKNGPVMDETGSLVPVARDEDLAKKLWSTSEEISGVKLEQDCNVLVSGPTAAMMF